MAASSLLHLVDRATLTPVVSAVLDHPTAVVSTWEQRPVGSSYGGATAGLYRLSGTATDTDTDAELPWSVVLKVLSSARRADRPWHHAADQSQPDYWPREAFVYQSGVLADRPAGFAAPRCYAVQEATDTLWLWLEDITCSTTL